MRRVNPLTKVRSGAASAGRKLKSAGSTVGSKTKAAGSAVASKPKAAGSAVGNGFKWAGGGISSQTKSARDAVVAKASPLRERLTGLWNQAKEKFQTNPQMGIAAILGLLLVIAWIGWAIYVTSTNGANAGLGVVISWPAVFMALALVMAPFVGLFLLIRRLQGNDPSDPPIAGGAPDDSDSSATARTYPG